jgi:hypothetical protein
VLAVSSGHPALAIATPTFAPAKYHVVAVDLSTLISVIVHIDLTAIEIVTTSLGTLHSARPHSKTTGSYSFAKIRVCAGYQRRAGGAWRGGGPPRFK